MPVDVIQPDDLDQKKKGATASPGVSGGGVPAPIGGGSSSGPTSSGRFTNIQSVIKANQGNRLSQNVAQGITNQAQQAQQGVQSAQQQFQQQSQAANFANEANKQKVQQLLTDPTKASASDVSEFEKFRTAGAAGYTGPNELQDAAVLRAKAERAQQLGQSTGSAEGRQALLRQMVGGQGYNAGKQRLDTLLLDPRQLTAARQQTQRIAPEVEKANMIAQQQANQLKGQAQKFTEDTQKQLAETQKTALSPVEARVKAEQDKEAARAKEFDRIEKLLQGQSIDEDLTNEQAALTNELSKSGFGYEVAGNKNLLYGELALNKLKNQGAITPEQYGQLKGQLVGGFNDLNMANNAGYRAWALGQPGGQQKIADAALARNAELLKSLQLMQGQNLTNAGLATDEERARLNALQRLAGQIQTFSGDKYQAGKINVEDPNDTLNRINESRIF